MATNKRVKKTQRGLGTSDTATIIAMFPADPVPLFTPDAKILVDGSVLENDLTGQVNLDYANAPAIEEKDMYPNVVSPGPGSTNPKDQAEPKPTYSPSGAGSTDSPKASSEKIAKQTIGELIKGSSSGVP
jgi:hypothetical protein